MRKGSLCFAAALLLVQPAISAPKTHCGPTEIIRFSCQVKNSEKVVSLCSGNDKKDISWLQYRFGSVGHPELIYPAKKAESLNKFGGYSESHRHYPDKEEVYSEIEEVWFRIGKFAYLIESQSSSPLEEGSVMTPTLESSLVVFDKQRVTTTFNCSQPIHKNLSALFSRISDDQMQRP